MEYTLYTKAEIAAMIEDGIPTGVTIYYFNPSEKSVGNKVYMSPISAATFANITDENAGFIGVLITDNADPEAGSGD